MSIAWAVALIQAGSWVAQPGAPAVGDTVWVQRVVELPPGWIVRPSSWVPELEPVEALGPAVTVDAGDGTVVVRYPLVVWEPGVVEVLPPPVWRIGPAGEADSVASGPVNIAVRSLVPSDSVTPRPPRPPLERDPRALLPVFVSMALGGGVVAAAWWVRRRPVRPTVVDEPTDDRDVSLGSTGSPRIDAARLAIHLRRVVAHHVPAAHGALTTEECLAVVANERPDWPLDDLRATLMRLDTARFAPVAASDLPALAEEVGALERAL